MRSVWFSATGGSEEMWVAVGGEVFGKGREKVGGMQIIRHLLMAGNWKGL